ncbi:homeodomain-like protein [Tanacetum coccineum]
MIDKDEACFYKPVIEVDYGFVSGKLTDLPVCTTKDVDSSLPGRLSTSSWASSTLTEEDVGSDASAMQTPDAYSYLLEHSPLKQVPIGTEYQAEIPEWRGYDEDEIKFLGSCVIPMPQDSSIDDSDTVGSGRTDCYCNIPESLECVQQHIKDARETLKASIGHEVFAELGFGSVGEVVAEKWSEEDEKLFQEVVYSHPVSSGENFWNHLAAEFPSRTSQEIVSYYFNVLVLRRRAEQNRCDPMNADSDDDEWQGSDGSEEEVEIHEFDLYEHGNGIEGTGQLHNRCSVDSTSQPSENTVVVECGDVVQYDSCTSSDTGEPCISKVKVDSNKSWGNHEFIFEPLDSRVWDVGFFSCPRTNTDFLPTGCMIEEIFGDESWD